MAFDIAINSDSEVTVILSLITRKLGNWYTYHVEIDTVKDGILEIGNSFDLLESNLVKGVGRRLRCMLLFRERLILKKKHFSFKHESSSI